MERLNKENILRYIDNTYKLDLRRLIISKSLQFIVSLTILVYFYSNKEINNMMIFGYIKMIYLINLILTLFILEYISIVLNIIKNKINIGIIVNSIKNKEYSVKINNIKHVDEIDSIDIESKYSYEAELDTGDNLIINTDYRVSINDKVYSVITSYNNRVIGYFFNKDFLIDFIDINKRSECNINISGHDIK